MQEHWPFFISPAYSVPRITISFSAKFMATDVEEVMPAVYLKFGNTLVESTFPGE